MKIKLKRLALYVILSGSFFLRATANDDLRISILGDSYSTFEGHVTPDSNAVWYFTNPNLEKTDLTDVSQTWWQILLSDPRYSLEKNNSYSGSTICNTGYEGNDASGFSFITRMDNLGQPDLILIFGATNDSWANSPIGEFVWNDWTEEDLKSFRPALAFMLEHLTNSYSGTKFLYIINDGLKPEITNSIVEACTRFSIPYIQLKDIDKTAGHPNIKGMGQIASQVSMALSR